ncbi:Formate/nitrite transporter [Cylindrobasidium torrendii FP15055 ss-10]|uniref:Formate/nitrite transporter n=1 Tax=Cylindrobasidium torrendii FP15055 ss-10 TaxID=1314674 RepID=A0A0D7BBK1_9AGAR|nr:Formate/nitrite transporter [Cylindrobasidium torrendii FP15055 ss-10]
MDSTLRPAEVAHIMVDSAIAKHRERYDNLFLKAFVAGVMLSFGGLLMEVLGGGATSLAASDPGIVKILQGFVFPVGLVMIVLQGLELLTSNMMVMPMGVVARAIPWWSVPVNWTIVFFGNLTGSLFFAAILVKYSGILSAEPYNTFAQHTALTKAAVPEWHQIFLRGIGCNWLVCVAVWQAAGARETISKIFALWIPIWVFVACSFDHVVANMFIVPIGMLLGADLSAAAYIRKSLIAAFLGNAVGGLLVGLPAYWFYLRDYHADGLRTAETGQALTPPQSSSQLSSREDKRQQ